MSDTPVLEVSGLTVEYRRGRKRVPAVSDVSFSIREGETVGLVGESGSGKTTIGRAILGLVPVSAGSIVFDGHDVTGPAHHARRREEGQIRAVFQDPYSSLNPSLPVAASLAEECGTGGRSREATFARMVDLFEKVGLPSTVVSSYPGRLSGGQRQRVAIARALMSDPRLIICDEPVSALDVSVQAQVLNLLRQIQRVRSLSYCFVGHDLDVVRYMSDWIVVLYRGHVLEDGPARTVAQSPRHPYTRALVAASPHPVVSPEDIATRPPSSLNAAMVTTGCPFAPRCPVAIDVCWTERPPVCTAPDGGKVACHRYDPVKDTTPTAEPAAGGSPVEVPAPVAPRTR
ncbi:ABC transporter ATP-binding protein [Streptomyces jeddahensis]|uniref:Oligopeptide transport ATP-binding protein OppF n=1 Tax=Streptomyces jeddahensis TaxID=1716141 RepID=A0A177I052_9ACTN|nr:ABC transporter ATP-binding protein [Streptomyces jeddahensis]OAH16199.1 oligopeptide transport ATP-binding protein OppF [Streptomyces jeddahensis]